MGSINYQHAINFIEDFLTAGFADDLSRVDECIAEPVLCYGFPEFNPRTRPEYKAFFRCMADAIHELEFSIAHINADDKSVTVHFHITGIHHEELMGFAASGSKVKLTVSAVFTMYGDQIVKSCMSVDEVKFFHHVYPVCLLNVNGASL